VEPVTDPTTERSVIGALDDGSDNYVYTVTYRATAPNGRSAVGDGTCAAAEKQRGRMKATDHNVRSHAHTRAWNRAVSNLVGFGEVSAEEVERGEPDHDAAPAVVRRPDGSVLVTDIATKTGSNAKGPWTMYLVTFDDGRSASTFDEAIARRAAKAKADGVLVKPAMEQKGKFWNLTGLELADAPGPDAPMSTGGVDDDADTPMSDGQRNKLYAVMRGQGWTEDDVHDLLAREFGLDSVTAITRGVYDDVLNQIKAVSKK
jgi:hypothetical protein